MTDYVRDPAEIYRRSFATIRAEADLSRIPEDLEKVAVRLIHACGMTDIVQDLVWSEGAGRIGREALLAGAPVLVDSEMVSHGVIRPRLPRENLVICTVSGRPAGNMAEKMGITRSAAAVELWRPFLPHAVVSIGNAPTALFHLLDIIAAGAPRPALILGFPVGFIGAAEAKQALAESGLPHIALLGRRGGSAMAAAAVNALALEREA